MLDMRNTLEIRRVWREAGSGSAKEEEEEERKGRWG